MVATIGETILDLQQFPLRNALVRDERLANQGMRMLIIVRLLYGKRE
jgi:hypothetical protein